VKPYHVFFFYRSFFFSRILLSASKCKTQIGGQRLWNLPGKCDTVIIFFAWVTNYRWDNYTAVQCGKIDVLWAGLYSLDMVRLPRWKNMNRLWTHKYYIILLWYIPDTETTAAIRYVETKHFHALPRETINLSLGFWSMCCSLLNQRIYATGSVNYSNKWLRMNPIIWGQDTDLP